MRSGGEKEEREAGDEEPRFMIFCFACVRQREEEEEKARARALF